GRMRCFISVGGTVTMRFSHSKTLWGTGMNLATVPHKLRPMFIADDGYELAELDLNRGESWIYAYLSMDPELIRIHTTGMDFHAETAAAIQGVFGDKKLTATEITNLAKEGDPFGFKLRFLGKKDNHASAYRMGPFKGAEIVNEEADETNITVTPSQMKEAQQLWLKKYSGIQPWWDEIDRQVKEKRYLITPYGRRRDFFGFMSDSLLKSATAQVPQSTSVDYLNYGMLRVYDEMVEPGLFRLELLHQNHDSILVQYPTQHRDQVIPEMIKLIESTLTINGHDITIPVEARYGQNWGDYHKEKNPEGLRDWAA
ncbi:MAG: DNA polymerase, partial [Nitrosopumilus sp.]